MKKLFLLFSIAICTIANSQYTQLTDFTGNGSFAGAHPDIDQNLISVNGELYGMTSYGGLKGMGVIFKIKPDGTGYSRLLDFAGATNGRFPTGSLIFDGTFLYGVTAGGGANTDGTVFKIKPDGTGYSKLLHFTDAAKGSSPQGSLFFDGTFLYGMTSAGGANGDGTLFKIKPNGTGYSKLLDFSSAATGKFPVGTLISDGTFLYAMTSFGGTKSRGVLFKIKPDGAGYSKLLDFAGGANGNYPSGSLISDGTFLYGMANSDSVNSAGIIFKIKPDGSSFEKLVDFTGAANGSDPAGSLLSDGTFLYGMTSAGGTDDIGIIFKIRPDGTGYSKLLDFEGTATGDSPLGSFITDGTFLYGMTWGGGINGDGTVFKIMPDGAGYSKLLDFARAAMGSFPLSALVSDGTFLYGMTNSGGARDNGTIFKIKPDGTGYYKLLDFAEEENGRGPHGSLISDGTFLYGMTEYGGTNDMGVIFKLTPDGSGFEKLLDFAGAANGSSPHGSLMSDGTFLYGMTYKGGANDMGIIFKIKPDGSGFEKLLDFAGLANGMTPRGSFITDGIFLYGMTSNGGTNNAGTIFKIKPDGTGYFKLHEFEYTEDGNFPLSSLISDGIFLYGMTQNGGTDGAGTLFKIKPDGTDYSKLLDCNITNGRAPRGSLITDGTFLYGTTAQGGGINDMGVIFKIKPDGSDFAKLWEFSGGTSGNYPWGSLITDGVFLYGMTAEGGPANAGTVFKIKLDFTGITENNEQTYFTIYPNPFSSRTTLSTDKFFKSATLTIYNLYGEAVRQMDNLTGQTIVFQRADLPSGLYFLQLTEDNKIIATDKLLITDN